MLKDLKLKWCEESHIESYEDYFIDDNKNLKEENMFFDLEFDCD